MPIKRIIQSNWHILSNSSSIGQIFKNPPLFASKRDHNLRDLLVRSRLFQKQPRAAGTSACLKHGCNTCGYICRSTQLTAPNCTFTIKRPFSCNSWNIIYAITCTKDQCNMVYIGETCRMLRERFQEHHADTRLHNQTPVANHFNSAGHNIQHMRIRGLWQCYGDDLNRKLIESHWIDHLGTLTPLGLKGVWGCCE